jgi:hypothetical protein
VVDGRSLEVSSWWTQYIVGPLLAQGDGAARRVIETMADF